MQYKSKLILVIAFIIISRKSFAFSDAAFLVEIIANTAATVSNTLKILEVAKTTTGQLDHYNQVAMNHYYRAERIRRQVEELKLAMKLKPKSLNELNLALMELKANLSSLKGNLGIYLTTAHQHSELSGHIDNKMEDSRTDYGQISQQELASSSNGTMADHVQNTAVNSAMTARLVAKMRQDHLESKKVESEMHKNQMKLKANEQITTKKWLEMPISKEEVTYAP